MKKRILISVVVLLVLGILLGFLQLLVVPKYTDNREGALIREYYAEAGENDVIFVGDCEIYESFIPAVMWEEYGITSYLRGSPQQLAWHSYYLLEETFRYEKPKAVVYNVLALKYGEPQSESFNRMTLDGMKWSSSKTGAIRASMTEEESFLDYLFPFLRYHSRITELTSDDLTYAFAEPPTVSHSGYLMQTDILPKTEEEQEDEEGGRLLSDYTLPESSMAYLEKMRVLCEENGSELILVKAPTNTWAYWWYDEWEEQIEEYALSHGLAYYNFIPLCEEIGIDWNTDTYDKNVHLNVYGAEKLSRYFGQILSETHGIADRRQEPAVARVRNELLTRYKDDKEQSIKERNQAS